MFYLMEKWWKGILTLAGVMKSRDRVLTLTSQLTHWTVLETKGKLRDLMFNQFPVVSWLGLYLLSSRERFLRQLSVCIPRLIAALLRSKSRNPGGFLEPFRDEGVSMTFQSNNAKRQAEKGFESTARIKVLPATVDR